MNSVQLGETPQCGQNELPPESCPRNGSVTVKATEVPRKRVYHEAPSSSAANTDKMDLRLYQPPEEYRENLSRCSPVSVTVEPLCESLLQSHVNYGGNQNSGTTECSRQGLAAVSTKLVPANSVKSCDADRLRIKALMKRLTNRESTTAAAQGLAGAEVITIKSPHQSASPDVEPRALPVSRRRMSAEKRAALVKQFLAESTSESSSSSSSSSDSSDTEESSSKLGDVCDTRKEVKSKPKPSLGSACSKDDSRKLSTPANSDHVRNLDAVKIGGAYEHSGEPASINLDKVQRRVPATCKPKNKTLCVTNSSVSEKSRGGDNGCSDKLPSESDVVENSAGERSCAIARLVKKPQTKRSSLKERDSKSESLETENSNQHQTDKQANSVSVKPPGEAALMEKPNKCSMNANLVVKGHNCTKAAPKNCLPPELDIGMPTAAPTCSTDGRAHANKDENSGPHRTNESTILPASIDLDSSLRSKSFDSAQEISVACPILTTTESRHRSEDVENDYQQLGLGRTGKLKAHYLKLMKERAPKSSHSPDVNPMDSLSHAPAALKVMNTDSQNPLKLRIRTVGPGPVNYDCSSSSGEAGSNERAEASECLNTLVDLVCGAVGSGDDRDRGASDSRNSVKLAEEIATKSEKMGLSESSPPAGPVARYDLGPAEPRLPSWYTPDMEAYHVKRTQKLLSKCQKQAAVILSRIQENDIALLTAGLKNKMKQKHQQSFSMKPGTHGLEDKTPIANKAKASHQQHHPIKLRLNTSPAVPLATGGAISFPNRCSVKPKHPRPTCDKDASAKHSADTTHKPGHVPPGLNRKQAATSGFARPSKVSCPLISKTLSRPPALNSAIQRCYTTIPKPVVNGLGDNKISSVGPQNLEKTSETSTRNNAEDILKNIFSGGEGRLVNLKFQRKRPQEQDDGIFTKYRRANMNQHNANNAYNHTSRYASATCGQRRLYAGNPSLIQRKPGTDFHSPLNDVAPRTPKEAESFRSPIFPRVRKHLVGSGDGTEPPGGPANKERSTSEWILASAEAVASGKAEVLSSPVQGDNAEQQSRDLNNREAVEESPDFGGDPGDTADDRSLSPYRPPSPPRVEVMEDRDNYVEAPAQSDAVKLVGMGQHPNFSEAGIVGEIGTGYQDSSIATDVEHVIEARKQEKVPQLVGIPQNNPTNVKNDKVQESPVIEQLSGLVSEVVVPASLAEAAVVTNLQSHSVSSEMPSATQTGVFGYSGSWKKPPSRLDPQPDTHDDPTEGKQPLQPANDCHNVGSFNPALVWDVAPFAVATSCDSGGCADGLRARDTLIPGQLNTCQDPTGPGASTATPPSRTAISSGTSSTRSSQAQLQRHSNSKDAIFLPPRSPPVLTSDSIPLEPASQKRQIDTVAIDLDASIEQLETVLGRSSGIALGDVGISGQSGSAETGLLAANTTEAARGPDWGGSAPTGDPFVANSVWPGSSVPASNSQLLPYGHSQPPIAHHNLVWPTDSEVNSDQTHVLPSSSTFRNSSVRPMLVSPQEPHSSNLPRPTLPLPTQLFPRAQNNSLSAPVTLSQDGTNLKVQMPTKQMHHSAAESPTPQTEPMSPAAKPLISHVHPMFQQHDSAYGTNQTKPSPQSLMQTFIRTFASVPSSPSSSLTKRSDSGTLNSPGASAIIGPSESKRYRTALLPLPKESPGSSGLGLDSPDNSGSFSVAAAITVANRSSVHMEDQQFSYKTVSTNGNNLSEPHFSPRLNGQISRKLISGNCTNVPLRPPRLPTVEDLPMDDPVFLSALVDCLQDVSPLNQQQKRANNAGTGPGSQGAINPASFPSTLQQLDKDLLCRVARREDSNTSLTAIGDTRTQGSVAPKSCPTSMGLGPSPGPSTFSTPSLTPAELRALFTLLLNDADSVLQRDRAMRNKVTNLLPILEELESLPATPGSARTDMLEPIIQFATEIVTASTRQ